MVSSLEEAITLAKMDGDLEPFIIGGGEVYNLALEKNLINKIYLTRVHGVFQGDTFFPKINKKHWKETSRIRCDSDKKHDYDYTFITYKKCTFDKTNI